MHIWYSIIYKNAQEWTLQTKVVSQIMKRTQNIMLLYTVHVAHAVCGLGIFKVCQT